MAWAFIFLTITILILINALYVAAEFATVSSRRSRLTQLATGGNRLAENLLPVVQNRRLMDTYIATCQIGITASSLLLGFFGQARLTPLIEPIIAQLPGLREAISLSIAATIVLISLTSFQVIFGELIPKSVSIQYPEKLALFTTLPLLWSMALFKPIIWVFNGSGLLILKIFGKEIEADKIHLHAYKEILMLFEQSGAGGLLDHEEHKLLINTLQFRRLTARQVMIPRNRMLSAAVDESAENLLALLADSPYSRLPVHDGSIDNIIGFIHLKDLLCLHAKSEHQDIRNEVRPVIFIPETMPVDKLFAQMQKQRYQISIVLDEYGGTAGFITLEDLIEEIFGELQDEFDTETTPSIEIISEDRVQIRGDLLISELNELLDVNLPTTEVETIGGLVINELGHIPEIGEQINLQTIQFVVEEMEGNGIKKLTLIGSPELVRRLSDWLQ
jgi:putative hemolysin